MEDTRYKPTDEVFNDIKDAAMWVWSNTGAHPDYQDEKIQKVNSIQNYADNWSSIIGMFDSNNRMLHYLYLQKQATVDFLISCRPKYKVFIPKEKV